MELSSARNQRDQTLIPSSLLMSQTKLSPTGSVSTNRCMHPIGRLTNLRTEPRRRSQERPRKLTNKPLPSEPWVVRFGEINVVR